MMCYDVREGGREGTTHFHQVVAEGVNPPMVSSRVLSGGGGGLWQWKRVSSGGRGRVVAAEGAKKWF